MATATKKQPPKPDDSPESKEELARAAVTKAKIKLMMGKDARSVFFATLALRLQYVVDWDCPTAYTDGRVMAYNPDYVLSLTPSGVQGLVIEEVAHNALQHMTRRQSRQPMIWNAACDLAILKTMVKDAGWEVPDHCWVAGEGKCKDFPPGLSAEHYYSLLMDKATKIKIPAGGTGQGEVRDAPGGATEQAAAEAEWKVAVLQAAQVAKQRGELPAGIALLVDEIGCPKVPWRNVLREFVRSHARNDYSWSRQNRRYIHMGMYLPGLHSEELGEVVVFFDTSGSVGKDERNDFAAELSGVLDAYDCELTIVYCDCAVQHVQKWKSTDGPLTTRDLEPKGGGGTSHVPCWEWLRKAGINPVCCICLTDMATDFGRDPGVPVLWAATGNYGSKPPFGQVVSID